MVHVSLIMTMRTDSGSARVRTEERGRLLSGKHHCSSLPSASEIGREDWQHAHASLYLLCDGGWTRRRFQLKRRLRLALSRAQSCMLRVTHRWSAVRALGCMERRRHFFKGEH